MDSRYQQLSDPSDIEYEYEDYDDYAHQFSDYADLSAYNGQGENGELIMKYRIDNHDVREEVSRLGQSCMGTVLWQSIDQMKLLLILCLLLRITALIMRRIRLNPTIFSYFMHSISCLFGLIVLYDMFKDIFQYVLYVLSILIVLTYLSNWILSKNSYKSGLVTSFITVTCIIMSEMFFSDATMWNRIRGSLLLMSMKIISLSFDVDAQMVEGGLPNLVEYISYCMHPGTLIFGPWISVSEYRDSLFSDRPISVQWILCIAKRLFQSYLCLLLSVCVLPYLFLHPMQLHLPAIVPTLANNWMLSYETALSFHFSHYYISYLSTVTCLLSGVGAVTVAGKKIKCDDDDDKLTSDVSKTPGQPTYDWSEFVVTKPLSVEVPRSLLNVVVAWNIPMSKWLKTYVFDTSRFLGDFPAILFTYAASAMLHGLSFHLAAVLVSLGFYTYTEHSLRLKLSRAFNCPAIQARPKKQATASPVPIWAKLFNLLWIAINIMHLAYLGSMFQSEDDNTDAEGYSMSYTIEKWSNLGYVSHIFAIACFIFNWLI